MRAIDVAISRNQIRYGLISFVVIPALANALINSLLGWLIFRGIEVVPLWALTGGVAADLLGMCYFLPAITCLIATLATRRHVHQNKVEPLPAWRLPPWLDAAVRYLIWRCAFFGLTAVFVVGSATVAALAYFAENGLTLPSFLMLKTTLAVLLGLIVTPPIGLLALADRQPRVGNASRQAANE